MVHELDDGLDRMPIGKTPWKGRGTDILIIHLPELVD